MLTTQSPTISTGTGAASQYHQYNGAANTNNLGNVIIYAAYLHFHDHNGGTVHIPPLILGDCHVSHRPIN